MKKHYSVLLIMKKNTQNGCHAWCTTHDDLARKSKQFHDIHINLIFSLHSFVIILLYIMLVHYIHIYIQGDPKKRHHFDRQ